MIESRNLLLLSSMVLLMIFLSHWRFNKNLLGIPFLVINVHHSSYTKYFSDLSVYINCIMVTLFFKYFSFLALPIGV